MSAILPFPADLDVDDDGYPNDERIEEIIRASDVANAASWLVHTFPLLVKSIPYGVVEVKDGFDNLSYPIKIISYSTCGWSGQESLVGAVERSLIGFFYLQSWRRGGHYEFWVPLSRLCAEITP